MKSRELLDGELFGARIRAKILRCKSLTDD